MGMKKLLDAHLDAELKHLKKSAKQKETEDVVYDKIIANSMREGQDYIDVLREKHDVVEATWLKANVGKGKDSEEFKRVANHHIKIRNSFAVRYHIEPEDRVE